MAVTVEDTDAVVVLDGDNDIVGVEVSVRVGVAVEVDVLVEVAVEV